MHTTPPTAVVLGVPFHNVTFQEAVEWARQRIRSRKPGYIATANMDFVMLAWQDPELQRILLEADFVVADGIPIVWLSTLLGPRLKARVTGSDLVPMLAEMARDNHFSIFLLGGARGVADKAAEVLVQRYPGLRIAGCYAPPWAPLLEINHAEILKRIKAANPDLLLVAFGAPKQEKWVNLHVRNWQVPLAIGVGASLDFLAGVQRRAPRIVQRMAMEWFWRMCSDPPRLVGRYLRNILFFVRTSGELLFIRCLPNRTAPIGADAALRRIAHVQTFEPLANAAQVQSFCAALAMQAPNRPVVLDLHGVPWLSSLEQGALLRMTTLFRQRQQPLILAGVGSRVRRLLIWCQLSEYLEIGGTLDELLAKLGARAAAARQGSILRTVDRVEIRLPQELTAANLDEFRKLIDERPDFEQSREWIFDASGNHFVDSSAIGYFMRLKKMARENNIHLRLTGVRPAVRRVFQVAKVDALLMGPE